jgi:hypothetical protein
VICDAFLIRILKVPNSNLGQETGDLNLCDSQSDYKMTREYPGIVRYSFRPISL